jgi:hypothetical protein
MCAVTAPKSKICYCCGQELPAENMAWDYLYPDDVAELTDDQRAAQITFQSRAVIVSDVGSFIRAILPVRLDVGPVASLGVWLAIISEADYDRIMAAGRTGGDAWALLTFSGRVANHVEPWPEVFGAMAMVVVSGPGPAPRITDSTDSMLREVLTKQWPHREFLQARGGGRS